MKTETLKEIFKNYPHQIQFDDINDFENFDERLAVVNCIVVNIIGLEDGFIEFIPDNNPPLEDEIFCWIWAFRPDLTKEILEQTKNENLKFALKAYLNNSMDKFWEYIS